MSALPELRDARATALALRARPGRDPAIAERVARIVDAVGREGTAAALRFTAQFDDVKLDPASPRVPRAVLEHARPYADAAVLEAYARALEHGEAQRRALGEVVFGRTRSRWIPRERLGLYLRRAPGFDGVAIATLVGLARAAGVREVIACTPPSTKPTLPGAFGVDRQLLATAAALGIDELFLFGGAQGVAQLASWVGEGGLVLGAAGLYADEARRQLAGRLAVPPEPEVPRLAIADRSGVLEGLEADVLLALDELAAPSGVKHAFRANVDQAVAFARAFSPARVTLLVAEPEPWLGRLTDAASISVGRPGAELEPGPPLTTFLRLQPVVR